MAEVYVFMTDGTEECEALVMVDLLRRANIETQTVAVPAGDWAEDHAPKRVHSLHHVDIACDLALSELPSETEAVFFVPGGKVGVVNMAASKDFQAVLQAHHDAGHRFASVCAGPTVLGGLGLIDDKKATVYPGFESGLGHATFVDAPIVEDEGLLTGRGLGVSIPLALALIEKLRGHAAAEAAAKQIVYEWEQE